jgi:hypothetical protein
MNKIRVKREHQIGTIRETIEVSGYPDDVYAALDKFWDSASVRRCDHCGKTEEEWLRNMGKCAGHTYDCPFENERRQGDTCSVTPPN